MLTATSDRVTPVFDVVARFYDDPRLQRAVYLPVQDQVVEQLAARRPACVLDVGCGTGILTARIAEEVAPERTIGCDRSPGMLAQARARSSVVEWTEGAAEAIPLEDGAVDAVVTTTAFHFFDQPAALREFHRVLAPGGSVLVATAALRSELAAAAIAGPAKRLASSTIPTRHGLRRMVADAGFVDVHQLPPARGVLGYADPMVVVTGRRAS